MDARPAAPPQAPAVTAPEVTLGALFLGFLSVALSGFGGVLPWVRRMIVERRRWLSEEEFTHALSLCQLVPGPNVVNLSVCVGTRFRGAPGAIAALAGLILAPFSIALGLGALYTRFGHLPAVRGALGGVSAAAAGLVLAMGIRMAMHHGRRAHGLLVIAAAFAGVALLRWPVGWVLLALMPLSLAAAWWRRA